MAEKCSMCNGVLKRVEDAPASTVDWSTPGSSQGYSVFQCEWCGNVEGCRWQYDAGTGADDRWHSFGSVDPMTVKRHY